MPQVTINYKKPETLKILKSLAKPLDFVIASENKAEDRWKDILIPGDPTIDISELKEIFSGKNIDAKQLRKKAWERKK